MFGVKELCRFRRWENAQVEEFLSSWERHLRTWEHLLNGWERHLSISSWKNGLRNDGDSGPNRYIAIGAKNRAIKMAIWRGILEIVSAKAAGWEAW